MRISEMIRLHYNNRIRKEPHSDSTHVGVGYTSTLIRSIYLDNTKKTENEQAAVQVYISTYKYDIRKKERKRPCIRQQSSKTNEIFRKGVTHGDAKLRTRIIWFILYAKIKETEEEFIKRISELQLVDRIPCGPIKMANEVFNIQA